MSSKKITAKSAEQKTERNVELDLVGTPAPKTVKGKSKKIAATNLVNPVDPKLNGANGKPAKMIKNKGKAKSKPKVEDKFNLMGTNRGRPSKFSPEMTIKVLKQRENREGTRAEKCWQMVKASKTVADYMKKRNAAGMTGVGAFLKTFVAGKFVQVR